MTTSPSERTRLDDALALSFDDRMAAPIEGLPYKLTRQEVMEQIREMGYDGEIPEVTIEEFISELRNIYKGEQQTVVRESLPLQTSSFSESLSYRRSTSPHRHIAGESELERELDRLGVFNSNANDSWSKLNDSTILQNLDIHQSSVLLNNSRHLSYAVPDRLSRRSPSPQRDQSLHKPLPDFTNELSMIEDKLRSINLSARIEQQRLEANSPSRTLQSDIRSTASYARKSYSPVRPVAEDVDPALEGSKLRPSTFSEHETRDALDMPSAVLPNGDLTYAEDPEFERASEPRTATQFAAKDFADRPWDEECAALNLPSEYEDGELYDEWSSSGKSSQESVPDVVWESKLERTTKEQLQRQLNRRFRLSLRQNDPVNLYHKYNGSWSRNKFLNRVSNSKTPAWAGSANKEFIASKLGVATSDDLTPAPPSLRAKLSLTKSLC